jgi:hypothetical protein
MRFVLQSERISRGNHGGMPCGRVLRRPPFGGHALSRALSALPGVDMLIHRERGYNRLAGCCPTQPVFLANVGGAAQARALVGLWPPLRPRTDCALPALRMEAIVKGRTRAQARSEGAEWTRHIA